MKCPSCGNEQAEGWLSCQKCHLIFSRWQPGAAASRPLAQGIMRMIPDLETEVYLLLI